MRRGRAKALRSMAAVFTAAPEGRFYGFDLARAAHVRSGRMYPLLTRLMDAGWLTDGWEATPADRPPRRYYQTTEKGRRCFAYLSPQLPAAESPAE